jgi:uncharacterized membrane protein
MGYLALGLISLVATTRTYIVVLEMLLWQKRYGALSVSRRILMIQTLPAVAALLALWLA